MLEAAAERYDGVFVFEGCPDVDIRHEGDAITADPSGLIEWLFNKKHEGEEISGLAWAFHSAIADMTVEMCGRIISDFELCEPSIALSGGTMNNSLLLKMLFERFGERGYRVYVNEAVPCGDGGLALGQMYHMMETEENQQYVCSASGYSGKY